VSTGACPCPPNAPSRLDLRQSEPEDGREVSGNAHLTTTKDDRARQHARKFAAKMSAMGLPYLFFEVTEGGHGAGANLREKAHTSAMEYVYFARKLMN
jgi:hypothetical protein